MIISWIFIKIFSLLKETLGNVDIYVNSIIPVTSAAQQKTAKYGEIPDWNEVIQRYCEFDHVPICKHHRNRGRSF